VVCRLRDRTAAVLKTFTADVTSAALSAAPCLALDLSGDVRTREDRRTKYIEYALLQDGEIISAGTTLFARPKAFDFLPAKIDAQIEETAEVFRLTLTADCFAKSVCLSLTRDDCVFSDNWFDIHGAEPVVITIKKDGKLTADALREQLKIVSY
jgi:beta-mannosidase